MPVASKPLDGRLRREAAMIGGLARLYASSVEPRGLTSLGRLEALPLPLLTARHGWGRQGRAAGPPPTALLSLKTQSMLSYGDCANSSGSFAIFAAIRRAVFSGQYNGPSCAGLGTLYKGQVCGLD
jgi:hypothetical protein